MPRWRRYWRRPPESFSEPVRLARSPSAWFVSRSDGGLTGGLVGALIGWGIPQEDAKYYEGEVKAGRYLVTVDQDDRGEAHTVFTRLGSVDRRKMV